MASSSKEKAVWNSEDVETFCKLCVDQIDKGNRPGNNKRDGWTAIITKFEELRGKKYDKAQMKSKWDNLKEEWKRWKSLTQKETGLGWDPRKNTIDASDEWWEKKIQGNPKFRAFRSKGIHPDLEVLLDRMFRDSVATGSVTWSPAQGLCVDEEVVATQLDIDDCANSTDNAEGDIGVKSDEQVQSHKRSSQSSVKQSQSKKKKKMGPADKISEQMKEIVAAFNDKTPIKEFDPYEDIMEMLTTIPEIVENEELHFFALEHFAEKKDHRQIFMNLRSNESRVRWIKYKFAKHNPQ